MVEWVNEISHILFIFHEFPLCYIAWSLRDYRVCCIWALVCWSAAQQVGQPRWSRVHKPIHSSVSCSELLVGDLSVTLSCLVCLVLQESRVWLCRWAGGTACVPETPAPATTPAARDCAPSGSVWRGTAAWSWGPGRETSVRTPWRRCCPPLCTAANVNEAWRRRRTAWVSTGACISPCCTVRSALTHTIWWFCSREVGGEQVQYIVGIIKCAAHYTRIRASASRQLNGEFQGEMKRVIIVSKIVKKQKKKTRLWFLLFRPRSLCYCLFQMRERCHILHWTHYTRYIHICKKRRVQQQNKVDNIVSKT